MHFPFDEVSYSKELERDIFSFESNNLFEEMNLNNLLSLFDHFPISMQFQTLASKCNPIISKLSIQSKKSFGIFECIYNNQCMQATKPRAKRKKKLKIERTENKQKHFFVFFNDCL